MEKIIEVKNISASYGKNEAISDISFQINRGEYVGIIGPNGGGKTSVIKALLGLLSLNKGSIKIYSQELNRFHDWYRIDYLPQNLKTINQLFPATVEEIVFLGLLSSKKGHRNFSKDDRQRVEEALNDLSINSLKNKVIFELSGGQQQKVMIARSLVSKPEILILDEPTTALDPKSREEFLQLIKKLNTDKKITIILITHDTNLICNYATKLMYIDRKILFFGAVSDFYKSKKLSTEFGEYGQHVLYHKHT